MKTLLLSFISAMLLATGCFAADDSATWKPDIGVSAIENHSQLIGVRVASNEKAVGRRVAANERRQQ